MKKTLSLKEPKIFQKVLNKGKWYGGNLISTYIMPNNKYINFIGLAIGKKVGKATKRNRVKRVIRAVYTNLEQNLNEGYNILFVWKTKAKFEDFSFRGIQKDIQRAFEKAGILKNE